MPPHGTCPELTDVAATSWTFWSHGPPSNVTEIIFATLWPAFRQVCHLGRFGLRLGRVGRVHRSADRS